MLPLSLQWARQLRAAKSVDNFCAALAKPLARCGVDEFLFVPAGGARVTRLRTAGQEFLRRYDEEALRPANTIFAALRRRRNAITWNAEALWKRSPDAPQRRIWECLLDSGYRRGISVPLHGPDSEFSHLSCIAPPHQSGFHHQPRDLADQLILIGTIAVAAFERLRPKDASSPACTLSHREIECLSWSARGKTAWEVGRILGITSRTVHFHVQKSMQKLDAKTKTQAIHEATRRGFLPEP